MCFFIQSLRSKRFKRIIKREIFQAKNVNKRQKNKTTTSLMEANGFEPSRVHHKY